MKNENNPSGQLQYNESDLGATENIIVRLSRIIPTNAYYKLYFDNYNTSISVMIY